MNILLVSYYYPPHKAIGATRVYLVSKYLGARGHNVTVLASRPQAGTEDFSKFPDCDSPHPNVRVVRSGLSERGIMYLRKTIFEFVGVDSKAGDNYQQTIVEASKRRRTQQNQGLGEKIFRVLRSDATPEKEAIWNSEALLHALRIAAEQKPDVVYVCGRPFSAFFVGVALKYLVGLPLVLDMRDPWSIMPMHDELTRRVTGAQEKICFAAADRILLNTRTALKRYQQVYPPHITGKLYCAPNAMSHWPPAQCALQGEAQTPEPLIVTHGGNLYRRSITPLMQAMHRIIQEQGLTPAQAQLRQIGSIESDTFDPDLVEEMGEHMQIKALLPFAEFQEKVREASVLVVLLSSNHYLRIPAKFYECLASGKAVLFMGPPDHEVVDVLENQLGVGVGADASDPEDIYRALCKLQQEVLPRLRSQGVEPERYRPFHIESRVEEIEAILGHVAGQSQRFQAQVKL